MLLRKSLISGSRQAMRAEVLFDDPLGYWMLDDDDMYSGEFLDSSGNGYDLTVVGDPQYAYRPLMRDGVRYANFNDDYAYNNSPLGLTMPYTGSWTVTATLINDSAAPQNDIFSIGEAGTSSSVNWSVGAILESSGNNVVPRFLWEYGSGSNEDNKPTSVYVAPSKVQMLHFVKEVSGKALRVYQNGLLIWRSTYVNEPTGGGSNKVFVGGDTTNNTSQMTLGHVAFFPSVLSEKRIRAHAVAGGTMCR